MLQRLEAHKKEDKTGPGFAVQLRFVWPKAATLTTAPQRLPRQYSPLKRLRAPHRATARDPPSYASAQSHTATMRQRRTICCAQPQRQCQWKTGRRDLNEGGRAAL